MTDLTRILMNRLLHSVFAALLCVQLPAIASADAPDPAKLKLHSANVIVMGAGDSHPHTAQQPKVLEL